MGAAAHHHAGHQVHAAQAQGGREGAEKAPLLRDQLIMQRGNYSRPRPKDKMQDVFAAEYSDETWHKQTAVNLPKGHGRRGGDGDGQRQRSPNERKFVARRRH